MNDSLERSFGLVIAYLLPGLLSLWGLSWFSPTLAHWLTREPLLTPTIGSFLYVTLGSLALGLTLSALRWAILDSLHHATGVPRPDLDFKQLQTQFDAFNLAVEHYYRYYQHYGNMLISLLFTASCTHLATGRWPLTTYLWLVILCGILHFASRDSLRRYYDRTSQLLGTHRTTTP